MMGWYINTEINGYTNLYLSQPIYRCQYYKAHYRKYRSDDHIHCSDSHPILPHLYPSLSSSYSICPSICMHVPLPICYRPSGAVLRQEWWRRCIPDSIYRTGTREEQKTMYRISTIYSICMCSCAIERCAIVLYAIAYASPPPPCMAPAPRIHRSSLPYTSGRPHSSRGTSRNVGRIYFTQEEKAPTAPLLIVHEGLAKTGECDHVVSVKDILAVSTQAKLHTRMHSTCTMLRYIFQPVLATAPSHLAPNIGGPARVQYALRLHLPSVPTFELLVLLCIHFLLGDCGCPCSGR